MNAPRTTTKNVSLSPAFWHATQTEIATLRAENAKLREALVKIATNGLSESSIVAIAASALSNQS